MMVILFFPPRQAFAYDYCFWSMDESQKDKFEGWYIFTLNLCFCRPIWCPLFLARV